MSLSHVQLMEEGLLQGMARPRKHHMSREQEEAFLDPAAVDGAVTLPGCCDCILVQKQLNSKVASQECCVLYRTLAGKSALPESLFQTLFPTPQQYSCHSL